MAPKRTKTQTKKINKKMFYAIAPTTSHIMNLLKTINSMMKHRRDLRCGLRLHSSELVIIIKNYKCLKHGLLIYTRRRHILPATDNSLRTKCTAISFFDSKYDVRNKNKAPRSRRITDCIG